MEAENNKSLSSNDIYSDGYNFLGKSGNLDSKSYFIALRKTVLNEYKQQGFCELIDRFVEKREDIDWLSFMVLVDLNNILSGGQTLCYEDYLLFPNSKKIFYWSKINRIRHPYMKCRATLIELRKLGQREHLNYINDYKNKIQQDCDKKLEEAKRQSDVNKEETHAEVGIPETKVLSENNEAEKDNGNNKKIAENLVRKYINEDRIAFKKELEDELNDELADRFQLLGSVENIHNEMCNRTDNLNAELNVILDSTENKIKEFRNEFYRHLHDWQTSLYTYELNPIAQRFIDLYRIINVDKLLEEEVIFQYLEEETQDIYLEKSNNDENKTFEDKEQSSELGEESKEDKAQSTAVQYNKVPATATLEGLKKLKKTLVTFLRQFELSLNSFEMYAYYPKEGDIFDQVWHAPMDDRDFDYSINHQIKSCTVPGIAKKVNDSNEDEVIIRAEVLCVKEDVQ